MPRAIKIGSQSGERACTSESNIIEAGVGFETIDERKTLKIWVAIYSRFKNVRIELIVGSETSDERQQKATKGFCEARCYDLTRYTLLEST